MAKRKKQRDKYVSKGNGRTVSAATRRLMREGYVGSLDEYNNKLDAWKRGKRVVLTIENPNKEETNRRYIKVTGNQFWGSPFAKKKSANNALANQNF